MSPLVCLLFFLVLTPLGLFMCRVTWPMVRENAGLAHRTVGAVVCVTGAVLVLGGVVFLKMAADGLAA